MSLGKVFELRDKSTNKRKKMEASQERQKVISIYFQIAAK